MDSYNHVAFKGDNGKYLRPFKINEEWHLAFTGVDLGDKSVKFTIEQYPVASKIRIRSDSIGKYWRRDRDDWILVCSDDTTDGDPDTMFTPTKIVSNVISLKNMNRYLERVSADEKIDCIRATATNDINNTTQLEVKEVDPE